MSLKKSIYIPISNAYEFEKILLEDDKIEGNYQLMSDIDFDLINKNKSICNFSGIFDGNNFCIKNYEIEKIDDDYIGLFSKISNSIIKNLNIVVNGKISGKSYIGLLIGFSNNSQIIDCKISGRLNMISNGPNVGGIVGSCIQSKLKNIVVDLENSAIRGTKTVGGLVGMISKSSIENCLVKGKLSIIGNFDTAEDFGGLIGYSSLSTIINSKVLFIGSIIGKKNVSGFVAIDYYSNYKNCVVDINGNLTSFEKTNLFCSVIIQTMSTFENCYVGNKTIINGILVNIFNILEFNKISDSKFKLVLLKDLYSDEIVSLSDMKLKIMDSDGVIYNIFDYILTFNQLCNLLVDNFKVLTEEEISKKILSKFKKKWIKLSQNEIELYKVIGFDQENFDSLNFPNVKWNQFSKKERVSALKLGFNKNIWDNKIIEGLNKNFYKFEKIGYVVNFSIQLTKMKLKIPNYIRDIILIEVKDFFTETFNNCLPDYKDFNVYFSDLKKLDIVLIFSNEIDEEDDVCKLDINNNGIIEKVSRYICLDIKYNNWVYINNFFRKNKDKYNSFLKLLLNKLFMVNIDCDFSVDIIDYDDNFERVKAQVILTESHADLIDRQDLNCLKNEEIIDLLTKVLPSNLTSYPTHITLKWKLFSNEDDFNKYNPINTMIKKYSVCIEEQDLGEVVEYNNISSTIIATVLINNIYAEEEDFLLIYVGNELRAKTNISISKEISWVNTKIFTNNVEEVVKFKIYQKCTNLLFEVPNLSYVIRPALKLGTTDNPICIKAQGKIPPQVIEYKEENFGKPVEYLKNMVTLFGYVIINYKSASVGDILGIYVNNELRGLTKVFIENDIPFVNTTFYSSGIEEEITFVVFDKTCKYLYSVPDIDLKVYPGQVIGSYYHPFKIRAIGKTLSKIEDYLNYIEDKPIINVEAKCVENETQTEIVVEEECESIIPETESDCESDSESVITIDRPTFISNYHLLKAKRPVKKINKVTGGRCSSGACAASGSGL